MDDKVIILFSGGIDSTAVLHRCLTEHGELYPVVHHVHLMSSENRHMAEAVAVKRILKWYKINKFNFDYIEMTFQTSYPLWDADIYGMTTGTICSMDGSITHFATGSTCTTYDKDGRSVYPGPNESEFQKIIDTHARREIKILPVFRDDAGKFLDKQGAWDLIPDELKPSIWSCRRPVYNGLGASRCHSCETCRDMNTLRPRARNNLMYEL